MSTSPTLPKRNTLIGITHTREGLKIIKEPRVLKIGVGLPRGKAADIFVDQEGLWNIRMGKKGGDGKLKFETTAKVKTRPEAEAAFRDAWKKSDVCTYPRKVTYFNFTRPVVGDDGTEIYVPDFQAIEAHSFNGERKGAPTEIDVVFLDDEPFSGSYAYWSSSELRCSGDGVTALQSVAMYESADKVPEPYREAWKAAKAAGERTFLISEGCWTCGCPFAKEQGNKPSACKPSGDLKFQLSRNIRVGGTAFFHTSGYRSIVQIFSAVERIKELTGGRIAGIPLKMVLRTYKTNHNGQPSLQSGISLEFRTEDLESLRRDLIEQAWKFRAAAGIAAPTRMLEAAPAELESFSEEGQLSAQAMAGEFYPDNDDEEVAAEPVASPASSTAAAASHSKTEDLAEKLAQQKPASVTRWSDRKAMQADFLAIKSELGDVEFQKCLTAASFMPGSAKFDDQKAAECYGTMLARKAEMAAAQQAPSPTQAAPEPSEGDLF